MKRHLLAATGMAVLLSPAAALAESRTLELPAFTKIDVASGIRAQVTAGPVQSIIVESNRSQELDDLRVDVREGKLYFWYEWNFGNLLASIDRNVTVTVTAPVIDGIGANSGAYVTANDLKADDIDFEASSGGRIEALTVEARSHDAEASSGASIILAGLCADADFEVSSGASIDAVKLDCTDVEFDVSSGATLQLMARGSIDGEVSSGGSATVRGRPDVRQLDTSSGGSISFRD